MKRCSVCGKDNQDNALFCAFCGNKFDQNTCKVCGQANPPGELFCVRCGNPIIEGLLIIENRYKLIKKIGVGGFGKTYLAEDLQLFGKKVVIKEFSMKSAKFDEFIKFTQQEGMILAKLNHPQIPKIHGFLEDKKNSKIYLIQDFVEGKNLRQLLTERTKLEEDEAIIILKDTLDILSYLHSFNPSLLHRDIKPENIIVDQNGKAYLVDYGAVIEYHGDKKDREIMYTKGYASPQQKQGFSSPSSDLYSLGIVAIEILTGLTPDKFKNEETGIVDYSVINDMSVELRDFLVKMTKLSTSDRFKNASEAKNALEVIEKIRTLRDIKISQYHGKIGEKERKEIIDMAKKLNISLDLINKVLEEEKHKIETKDAYKKEVSPSSPFITRLSIVSQATGVTTCKLIGKVQAHQGLAIKVVFSPKGEYMLTAGADGVIKVFGTTQWERKISIKATSDDDTLTDMKMSPNSQYLVVSAKSGNIKFFETSFWTRLNVVHIQNDEISEITFSPDSRLLFVGGYEKAISIFDMMKVEKTVNLTGHETWISCLEHSPKERLLVSGAWDGSVFMWDTQEMKLKKSFKEHTGQVKKIRFANSGRFFVTSANDGLINIWDPSSLTIVKRYQISEDSRQIIDIAITPNEKYLLIASERRVLVIGLDLMDKKMEVDLQTRKCTSISFFPQKNYFATSDIDGIIKLWKLSI